MNKTSIVIYIFVQFIVILVGVLICVGSFYLGVELSDSIKNWEKNHVSTKINS